MLKATLRSFLAHKGRLLLSALAIILSVAFVAGSLIFSDTVTHTFDRLFQLVPIALISTTHSASSCTTSGRSTTSAMIAFHSGSRSTSVRNAKTSSARSGTPSVTLRVPHIARS